MAFIVDDVTGLQQRHHPCFILHLVEKIRGFPLKAKSFRNTATYQKLRGGVPSNLSPCTTVGVWICVYVGLLINPNQHFMDFSYSLSIRKCKKRFVKMFACKTSVLENSFSIKAELSCETKTCRLVTAELRLNVSVNEKEPIPLLARQICEFTQQDGRTKRTAKRLCATNVTGLLLTC